MVKVREPGVYVVRFSGRMPSTALMLGVVISALFVVNFIVAPDRDFLARVAILLVLGIGPLLLYRNMRARVAFRVDGQGITLGAPWPLPRRQHELRRPWGSVAEVVLFREHYPAQSKDLGFVGLRLQPGAPRSDRAIPMMRRYIGGKIPHVPDDVLIHSRPILARSREYGWRLDEEKLAQAMAVTAPHVPIVRL
jgi:hypothetical protein